MTVFEASYVVQKQITEYGLHSLPSRYGGTYTRQAPFNQSDTPSGWVLVQHQASCLEIATQSNVHGRETGKNEERTLLILNWLTIELQNSFFCPWNCLKWKGNELHPYLDHGNRGRQLAIESGVFHSAACSSYSLSVAEEEETRLAVCKASPYRVLQCAPPFALYHPSNPNSHFPTPSFIICLHSNSCCNAVFPGICWRALVSVVIKA